MATHASIAGTCEAIVRLLRANYIPTNFNGAALDFQAYVADDFNHPMDEGVSVFLYRAYQDGAHRIPAGHAARGGSSMSSRSQASSVSQGFLDQYQSTLVVSLDPPKRDFTSLRPAINALAVSGSNVFVKAGIYSVANTIQIKTSIVQIQGEGMGITVFITDPTMTGDTPGLEVFSTWVDGTSRLLLPTRGDIPVQISSVDASSFSSGDYVFYSRIYRWTRKHLAKLRSRTAVRLHNHRSRRLA